MLDFITAKKSLYICVEVFITMGGKVTNNSRISLQIIATFAFIEKKAAH
jgi:hypothetical protein